MAGVDYRFRWQGQQLGLDAFHQQVIVAVNKVVAPDAVVKKGIPGKNMAFSVNTNATRGMSRGMQNGEM